MMYLFLFYINLYICHHIINIIEIISMKHLFLFIALLAFQYGFSQHTITGRIISEDNISLPGASIYLNNTTIGTTSNKDGYFELNFPDGNYMLVVSFLGYETQKMVLNSANYNANITLRLKESAFKINEVVVKQEVFGKEWQYNLERFKRNFLGRTELASTCKIKNEKALRFLYDAKTNTLTAYSRQPLKIKHKGLGYIINYDLVDFTIKGKYVFFSGYARYRNIRKHIRRKWKRNRLTAYHGSRMHFLRSLQQQRIKEDGFVVNQFKRVANPERPSKEEIKWARTVVTLWGKPISYKEIKTPKTQLDSAIVILNKCALPKYKDYLYKRNVPYHEMLTFDQNNTFLDFDNHLMVVYLNEPEEANYVKAVFSKRVAEKVQTSNIVLTKGKVKLFKSGIIDRPEALTNEGYWGFEAFATMLPLDYKPKKK